MQLIIGQTAPWKGRESTVKRSTGWILWLLVLLLAVLPLTLTAEEIPPQTDTELSESEPEQTPAEDGETSPADSRDEEPAQPGSPDEQEQPETPDEPSGEDQPEAGGDPLPEDQPEPDEAEDEAPRLDWDEDLTVGKLWRKDLNEQTARVVLRLTLHKGTALRFRAEGLPVQLMITNTETASVSQLRPDEAGEGVRIDETLNLRKGVYLILVEKLDPKASGTVMLTVSEPEPETPTETIEAAEAVEGAEITAEAAEPLIAQTEEAPASTAEAAEPGLPDTAEAVVTEESAGTEPPTETVEAVGTEEPAETELPTETVEAAGTEEPAETEPPTETVEAAGTEEPAAESSAEAGGETVGTQEAVTTEEPVGTDEAEPEGTTAETDEPCETTETAGTEESEGEETLTEAEEPEIMVSVTVSLNGARRLFVGTEVTLTAVLAGCDPDEVEIEWQYSPDGGETVVTVGDAHGLEYRYTVDRENRHYLWRAVAVRRTADPTER